MNSAVHKTHAVPSGIALRRPPKTNRLTDEVTAPIVPKLQANLVLAPNKAIPAELEIIVLKAMAKNPAERYETARDLADDLRRFLEDLPIRARRPTLVQRAAKWSRRHKPVVGAAVVLLVMATLGFASSTYLIATEKARTEDALGQTREAQREEARQRSVAEARQLEAEKQRRRAEQNYRTARAAVDRLFTGVAERLRDQPHMEQIRRELLEDALEFYQGFLKERSDNPELKLETALAHRRAGEIQGFLGDWEKSLANHQASAEILTELNRLSPANVDYRAHLARSHYYLVGALLKLARFQEAEAQLEAGLPMWEELVESYPQIPEYLEDFVRLNRRGQRADFLQYKYTPKYNAKANEMLRRLRKNFPNYPVEKQLTVTYGTPGMVKDIESLMESERKIREEIKTLEEQVEAHPDVPDYQGSLCGKLAQLKHVLLAMDRFEELEQLAPKAIVLYESLAEKYPGIQEYQIGLGLCRYTCGLGIYHMGREAEATEHFRVGIEIASKVLENDPNNVRHYNHLLAMLIYCPAPQFREPERALQLATRQLQLGFNDWGDLALAQVRAGRYEEALASCKKVKKGDAFADQKVAAFEAIAEWHVRNKEEAKRKFVQVTTAIDEDPRPNRIRHSLEYRLLRREVEEMMGITSNSDNSELWQARAAAYVQLKLWDNAIEAHGQVIKRNPHDAWTYVLRSWAHREKGDYAKAIDDCTSALRINPKLSGAFHNRAIAHRFLGHYEEALEDASKGLRIALDNAPLLQERALNYGHLESHDKAIVDYNEAIRLAPEDPGLYAARGEAYLALGRYDEALADCDKYAELRADDAVEALIRAQMLLMAKRTEKYRQACGELLERCGQSDDVSLFYHAARACVLAPEAISDSMVPIDLAERAVSSNPSAWDLYTLGMAHFRAGQLEEAARRFDESLNAYPDRHAVSLNWLGLALLHHARGETEEARRWLGKAVNLMEQHPALALQDRIEGQLLRRELEQLLGKSGQDNPTGESAQEE